MGFSVSNMSLTLDIAEALRAIQIQLFSGPAPQLLHHYTKSPAVVESVVRNRCLWATCIADQSDQAEISHTSRMVEILAEKFERNENADFSVSVLKRLPFFMEERKQWIFIACFCDDDNSRLHWHQYGDYRMTFPAQWNSMPSLGLSDSRAECWCQRVVYDEHKQEKAIEDALQSVLRAVSRNTRGRNEGPWAQAMTDNCARNVAQLLLGIAVGFKHNSFREEKEWRIVCAPPLGTNSSAPGWIDENFAVNIKNSPRRHVQLRVHSERHLFEPLLIPSVPFLEWACNTNRLNRDGIERINEALMSNHRNDLVRAFEA